MIQSFLICVLAVAATTAAPQFVTFKDGKIGVNFGGYTAEAGLGGLLTGNAAHGGLSASAGTPFGQRAAAGIGGLVNGEASGRAYAGAQATDSIGASAILGGNTGPNQRGIIGAEAHSNGNTVAKTITSEGGAKEGTEELVVPTDLPKERGVQKIKPPKKYTSVESPSESDYKIVESSVDLTPYAGEASSNVDGSRIVIVKDIQRVHGHHHKHIRPAHRRHYHLHRHIITEPILTERFGGDEEQVVKKVKTTYKTVERTNPRPTLIKSSSENQEVYQTVDKDVQVTPGSLNQWFNIPIGILQSIRDNLSPLNVRKQVTYTSSA